MTAMPARKSPVSKRKKKPAQSAGHCLEPLYPGTAFLLGPDTAEGRRLLEDERREKNWKRWGPYLAERQWGTVREDYSKDGTCWEYFPHDQARSRAYRWGEDGLLGFTDRECRLCFAPALWNHRDPYLKERLFGLTNGQGNHGEDVKELYYYLESTPTHSYFKALYKYPQAVFPYDDLIARNAARGLDDPEYEILDTGVFDQNRYFDVFVEYAKNTPNDLLMRITVANRGPDEAPVDIIPTLWFRNTWIWGCRHDGCSPKPSMKQLRDGRVELLHHELGRWYFEAETPDGLSHPVWLFTDNENNNERLWGSDNPTPYVKDAFHRRVVDGETRAVNPARQGTKAAPWFRANVKPGEEVVFCLRLYAEDEAPGETFGPSFRHVFENRIREMDEAFAVFIPEALSPREKLIQRQAYAGMLWGKQFYHYSVHDWLEGDDGFPPPSKERLEGRNAGWPHLFCRDVLSMPDKWEYPWFAAWDSAFHMIPFAKLDAEYAKHQLNLFLREWYMHPNGQLPAYEFAFDDVNPPVHAWACWRVYKITARRGERDLHFLAQVFHKLLINFTWWINRKDPEGKNLFAGGFLGLDNIGVFDRSKPLPGGGHLEQADGTAWMAFYCSTMLSMALELADHDPAYEGVASKFFEHFISIADAMNTLGGKGLWHEEDGFYYDQLHCNGRVIPLKTRSMVGLIPLFAVEILDMTVIDKLPGFKRRMEWFLKNRRDLAAHIACMEKGSHRNDRLLLAIPSRQRLLAVLRYMLDENEFLSPYGIRSLSKYHQEHPFGLNIDGEDHTVSYVPGDSNAYLFGGNSNWRGPVWMPMNYLIIESLLKYHYYYGDDLQVEYPNGSGVMLNLRQVAMELARRLVHLFLPDQKGHRPIHAHDSRYADDPHFKDFVLFYEFFHGDHGGGCGASHQTGWTGLIAKILTDLGAHGLSADEESKR